MDRSGGVKKVYVCVVGVSAFSTPLVPHDDDVHRPVGRARRRPRPPPRPLPRVWRARRGAADQRRRRAMGAPRHLSTASTEEPAGARARRRRQPSRCASRKTRLRVAQAASRGVSARAAAQAALRARWAPRTGRLRVAAPHTCAGANEGQAGSAAETRLRCARPPGRQRRAAVAVARKPRRAAPRHAARRRSACKTPPARQSATFSFDGWQRRTTSRILRVWRRIKAAFGDGQGV